jgi:IS30 family transposase
MSSETGWSQQVDATLQLKRKEKCMRKKRKKKAYAPRRSFSVIELREVWDGWKRGESAKVIGRHLGRQPSAVYHVVARYGGIRPRPRCRSARVLTLAEREEISRGIAAKESIRFIARRLSRASSTVSREIHRNGGYDNYRASTADQNAWERARRPKRCRLVRCPQLRQQVEDKLGEDWSPQQIAGWLKCTFPDDPSLRVSHETIYKSLFIQARGALRKELTQHLRSQRSVRRSPHARHKGRGGGEITDIVSISERPAAVEDRAVPGHWEGDLLVGSKNSYIATLVERYSRFVMLVKVPNKDTKTVVDALIAHAHTLPKELYKSLTWDRGLEMADHKRFTLATNIDVYFCDPKSPWQRGSNENTNGLLRQYFPKGTNLSVHSQEHLDMIAMKLNTRPRETLGFHTPAERLNASVALTG